MEVYARRIETCSGISSDLNHLDIETLIGVLRDLIEEEDADVYIGLSSVHDPNDVEISCYLMHITHWENFKGWFPDLDIDYALRKAEQDYVHEDGGDMRSLLEHMIKSMEEWESFVQKNMLELEFIP